MENKRSLPPLVVSRAKSAGAAGERWLAGLDDMVSELEGMWDMTVGRALSGGTHALVAYADGRDGGKYVLKADMPAEHGGDFESGVRVMEAAGGRGYARLYAYDPQRHACLMERLGEPLSGLGYPVFEQLRIICSALEQAWEIPAEAAGAEEGSTDWFREFIPEAWEKLGRPCSHKVIERVYACLEARDRAIDPAGFVLLHGDAHAGNTLREPDGDGFKLIDPDGILYEKAYDLGVLMREWPEEYEEEPLKKGRQRCRYLCRLTGVPEKGIWEWGFVQTVSTGLLALQTGQEEAGWRMLRAAEGWAQESAGRQEPDYIEELAEFLSCEYGLRVKDILPAKRGFYGETWDVLTEGGKYFLKIDYWGHHRESFRNSLPVIRYMADSGISFIPDVIAGREGRLWGGFRGGAAALFEHVPGQLSEDYPTERLYSRLARVYSLETRGLEIEAETFGAGKADTFLSLRDRPELPDKVRAALAGRERDIARYMERLRHFSAACRGGREGFCITHGDPGGNCVLDGDRLYIVDWDGAMLAPIERDAWIFISDSAGMEKAVSALRGSGIGYELRRDRLCYYCYDFFFHYLNEYLRSLIDAPEEWQRQQTAGGLADYLADCWIYERLDAADAMG